MALVEQKMGKGAASEKVIGVMGIDKIALDPQYMLSELGWRDPLL